MDSGTVEAGQRSAHRAARTHVTREGSWGSTAWLCRGPLGANWVLTTAVIREWMLDWRSLRAAVIGVPLSPPPLPVPRRAPCASRDCLGPRNTDGTESRATREWGGGFVRLAPTYLAARSATSLQHPPDGGEVVHRVDCTAPDAPPQVRGQQASRTCGPGGRKCSLPGGRAVAVGHRGARRG